VGLFVLVAGLVLLLAVALYLRQVATVKGWFLVRSPYFTFVESAAGIRVGDKVRLMGLNVGEITDVETMPPFAPWNICVSFTVHKPYEGYIWSDSRARVVADLLGNRGIELTKGGVGGVPTYLFWELEDMPVGEALEIKEPHNWKFGAEIRDEDPDSPLTQLYEVVTRPTLRQLAALGTNTVRIFNTEDPHNRIMAMYDDKAGAYVPFDEHSKGFFVLQDEAPALTQLLEVVVNQVEQALPHVLSLTNELRALAGDGTNLTRQALAFLAETHVVATNLAALTTQLREPDGALGRWLLSEAMVNDLTATVSAARDTLQAAGSTARTADTNVTQISRELLVSLEHLSLMTSNLNAQVQANAFILENISTLVRDSDELMQGLRRHWLLKGAFKEDGTPAPAEDLMKPTLEPITK